MFPYKHESSLPRIIGFTILAVLVILSMGCATGMPTKSPLGKVTIELGTLIENPRMSYSPTVEDDLGLRNLQPGDVIYTVELPEKVKAAVLWVTITCPKGTPIRIEWNRGGKMLYAFNTEMPYGTPGLKWHFWLRHETGLPSGEYTVYIELGADEFDQVDFTVK